MENVNNGRAFKNKYGYFTNNGYEFVITDPETPRPWTNIICNGDYGLAVSQAGGGFSWRTHVSMNRLTRWNQDLIRDDWGKWLYLRDLDSGALRSLAYQPVQAAYNDYAARHGLGYTVFEQSFEKIRSEWVLFAALDDPVEIWIVTLRNEGTDKRRFQLSSYFEWNLGVAPDNHREFHKLFIDTEFSDELRALIATKLIWEVPTDRGHWNTNWPYIAFHAVSEKVSGWDTSKDNLIGRHGNFHKPRGIKQGCFKQEKGRFQDAAASLASDIVVDPGKEKTLVFVLGQVDKNSNDRLTDQAAGYVKKYNSVSEARHELDRVKAFWRELTGQLTIQTPDDSFNYIANIWLKYQTISAHLWGRTGYFQQSGAYGFRDQLQSSQVWLPHDPRKMLDHIRLNARHQFSKGTVLHWWHPLTEKGLPTNMTDDLLWLPYMLGRYFREVGEYSALQETEPYYDEGEGTLQEHCTKAIDVVLDRFSERGLPLIGEGDWCDGFSAVGLDWKGESIWLGMFLYGILLEWAAILKENTRQKEETKALFYNERAHRLKKALNNAGWNGKWYIGATKDDRTPIGDPSQDECKIYLNSQTWAIINNVADEQRKRQIADAVLDHLEGDNGFMLFYPAFSKPDRYIGYITRYAPGLRENGGVYTHAGTWGIMAMAMLGRADDAMRAFNKLNPICQTVADVDRYQAEPYALPGNIDGRDSQYYGRAGWAWYTGSAGWLFTIAHENIAGIEPQPQGLKINPCIPADWPEIKIRRCFRGAIYNITVSNPHKKNGGVREMIVDGRTVSGNIIPLQKNGTHDIHVVLSGNS